MVRLPNPGSDEGTWGGILNDFLNQSHNSDGTLKTGVVEATNLAAGAVATAALQDGAVTAAKLSASGPTDGQVLGYSTGNLGWMTPTGSGSVPDADASTKGLVQLAGDLGGTAAVPTVPGLASKADEAVTVSGGTSLTGGGDLSANRTISLVNDSATPGSSRYYGTDGAGTKGFHAIPTQDPTLGGDLSGTASNAQIAAGAIVDVDVNAAAAIAQSKIANLSTDLSGKLPTKNSTQTLTDSTNDRFVRYDIDDDGSPTGSWPDRFAFYFAGTRTGYHNEYGEMRARPGKSNTVAFRAQKWAGSSTVDILQVTSSDNTTVYLGVGPTDIDVSVPIVSTSSISATGTVTGSNIGNKVTTSSTAPSSPSVGDVWIDTSA